MTPHPLPRPELTITIARSVELAPEMNERIDRLDDLAFNSDSDEAEEPDLFNDLEWSSSDVMLLGWLDDELVSQVGILRREILVGGKPLWVGGIGGVATLPDRQGKGYAGKLMRRAETYMRDEMGVPFGLLICGWARIPMYAHLGWELVAGAWRVVYKGGTALVPDNIMALRLSDQAWPAGEIDICGKPW
jgi:GNAT superfamily N-acetyltransferase